MPIINSYRSMARVAAAAAPVSGAFALQFPSNSGASNTTDPYAVIRFVDPHLDGLPLWGLGGAGITVILKVRTKSVLQPGYSTRIWHSRGDTYFVDPGDNSVAGNWGFGPYPAKGFSVTNDYGPGGSGYSIHEIATNGRDIVDDQLEWVSSGQNPSAPILNAGYAVNADTTYIQALRITRNNADSKDFAYYFNLPSTAAADVITWNEATAGYGETAAPSPMLTMGDSPWFSRYQHERMDATLDWVKIFNNVLTQAETVAEAADSSRIVTAAGRAAIWWGRNGFDTGHDVDGGTIPCHFGTGRVFTILNPSATPAQRINLVGRVT